jgi:2-keto-4-pentenoate hydratase/2-oxohepta-3-ene-1,7-dioic acid hydratase in catechol pathway
MKKSIFVISIGVIAITCSGCLQFAKRSSVPRPASFMHLWKGGEEGGLMPLELDPKNIYGMGLTYASHLKETGSGFDPNEPPPVFRKSLISLNRTGKSIKIPTRDDLITSAERLEPGLGAEVDKRYDRLSALLDYEGELGFVLLEDVDWGRIDGPDYSPKIGYFLANDISARAIALLGEDMPNRHDYWGASKSFPNFLPVGSKMWAPNKHMRDSILSVEIVTKVNGVIRQKQCTSDIMYTPREMLVHISRSYPDHLPGKGDIVLTGTPSGVALQVHQWKVAVAEIFNINRFSKLLFTLLSAGKNSKFLKTGDEVVVSGGILGKIETRIVK